MVGDGPAMAGDERTASRNGPCHDEELARKRRAQRDLSRLARGHEDNEDEAAEAADELADADELKDGGFVFASSDGSDDDEAKMSAHDASVKREPREPSAAPTGPTPPRTFIL